MHVSEEQLRTDDVRGLVEIYSAILVRLEAVQGDPLDEHFSRGLARDEREAAEKRNTARANDSLCFLYRHRAS